MRIAYTETCQKHLPACGIQKYVNMYGTPSSLIQIEYRCFFPLRSMEFNLSAKLTAIHSVIHKCVSARTCTTHAYGEAGKKTTTTTTLIKISSKAFFNLTFSRANYVKYKWMRNRESKHLTTVSSSLSTLSLYSFHISLLLLFFLSVECVTFVGINSKQTIAFADDIVNWIWLFWLSLENQKYKLFFGKKN